MLAEVWTRSNCIVWLCTRQWDRNRLNLCCNDIYLFRIMNKYDRVINGIWRSRGQHEQQSLLDIREFPLAPPTHPPSTDGEDDTVSFEVLSLSEKNSWKHLFTKNYSWDCSLMFRFIFLFSIFVWFLFCVLLQSIMLRVYKKCSVIIEDDYIIIILTHLKKFHLISHHLLKIWPDSFHLEDRNISPLSFF